ncbi:beta-ketoacyl-ACP synthase III, partial [Acinetobacter baumannii]
SVSNEDLVKAFNQYADEQNAANSDSIAAGVMQPVPQSSVEFIVKASGIHSRHVVDREGIIDPKVMRPRIPLRGDDEPSLMA